MDTVNLHGEEPPRTGEQEEDHHEKKPVLKKVMDKVKKIKKAISKKSPRHGKEGGDDDRHQQGGLDEEEEEFEEDDEIKEDPAVHGGSAAGAGIGTRGIPGGEEQFDENQAKHRTENETEQNRSLPNPIIEQKQGDGLRLTTEKFIGDLTAPTGDAKANRGIEQSRAYESPATNLSTGENDGAERVSDGLGIINEESVEDPGAPRNELVYQSPTTGASTGAIERAKKGLGLINEDFIQDSTPPSTVAETNTSELTQVNESPTTGAGTGAIERAKKGLGLINDDFIQDSTRPSTEAEYNTRTRVNESPTSGARTGANEALAPRSDDETNKIIEESQVHLSPTSARSGMNELSGGDGLGSITNMELVEDPAAPKDDVEKNTNTEQSQGGKEVEIAPELYRSLEAMTVSGQNETEPELTKGGNSTYTGMVSSAASKVYELVTDAGTAVISKVKPEARKEGEVEEAVVNQSKGRSIKEYLTEKLTPGEDEKTLSELITEAGQKRNNETVEVPRQAAAPSDENEKGTGIVDKIRETVTSLIGGGGGSPKSPATETHRKEIEENDEFRGRPHEAISQEKGSSEELPTSYH